MTPLPAVALLVASTLATPVPADEPPVVGAHLTGWLVFDYDGTDRDGAGHEGPVDSVTFSYVRQTPDGEERHRVTVTHTVTPGVVKIPFKDALEGIPGGLWRCYVRLESSETGAGKFAPFLLIDVAVPKPPPSEPQNVRVELGGTP